MKTLLKHLEDLAQTHPQRLACYELGSEKKWCYQELYWQILHTAKALKNLQVNQGSRVACIAYNDISTVIIMIACNALGAIFIPINRKLSSPDVDNILQYIQPDFVMGVNQTSASSFSTIEKSQVLCDSQTTHDDSILCGTLDMPALILLTSGTTGRVKGVVLTERNVMASVYAFGKAARVQSDSVFLNDLPIHHIIGNVINIRVPLIQGASFILTTGFKTSTTLSCLMDETLAISHYFCIPQMAEALRRDAAYCSHKLKQRLIIFTGGAPYAADGIASWLAEGVNLINGYGSTEAGTVFKMPLDHIQIQQHAGSVGLPVDGICCRIVDEHGKICKANELGELRLKGDGVMAAYWELKEESQAAFDQQGWYRTGDIFYFDKDGFYYWVDRMTDMFVTLGENVYPAEIEKHVAAMSGVAECAVIGIPDSARGEVGHLFIVTTPENAITRQMVRNYLKQRISTYKIPSYVSFISKLPRNHSGKLLKSLLQKEMPGSIL